MTRHTLFAAIVMLLSVSLGGCHLYFEDRADSGGSIADPFGGDCQTNNQCFEGCYCGAEGTCEESGFCSVDWDCAIGFECDDRGTCVPEGSSTGCSTDSDCMVGDYCDEQSGTCMDSVVCQGDDECGAGYTCDERNTCVPLPCESSEECMEGCYCDTSTGECTETGTCDPQGECPEGSECDERNTCVPCEGGVCTPTCEELGSEAECLAADACSAVYRGINCESPDGSSCTIEESNCTCESFAYQGCVDNEDPAATLQARR